LPVICKVTKRGFGPINNGAGIKEMDSIELLQVTILFVMFWYAGLAVVEVTTKRKKPMATRIKR
jgi:hypothetical protein